MKYIKTLVGVLFATALFTTSTIAATDSSVVSETPALGAWTLSLAGAGSVGTISDSAASVGGELELGHDAKIFVPLTLGARQSVGWSDSNESSWVFGTKLFTDVPVLKLGSVQFDLGGNVEYVYGNVSPVWTAAPEAVVRLYLKKDVDAFLRAEYPFNLTSKKAEDRVVLTLGIRVRF